MQSNRRLLSDVITIAEQAGEQILSVYQTMPVNVSTKEDGSPLTQADVLAHQIITEGLKRITPDIPIISEEMDESEIAERHNWPTLWLVDPLDGTKEFIHRTDEFTVNIALISDHKPVLGVVYAPALDALYYAMDGLGSYKKTRFEEKQIYSKRPAPSDVMTVIASRRHGGDALDGFLEQLPHYRLMNAGSALKICRVAEGVADIYPRLGPTYEWDTAAGHAIIDGAGGVLYDAKHRPFLYNKRNTLLNHSFVVTHKEMTRFDFSEQ